MGMNNGISMSRLKADGSEVRRFNTGTTLTIIKFDTIAITTKNFVRICTSGIDK
jgi:hypothetical protein